MASSTSTLESLARSAQAGSRAAFGELVGRLHGPLFDFLRMRMGNEADAEEICQDTFLRAWQEIGRYDPRRPFKTWLYTVGKRLAVSRHRTRSRERTQSVEAELAERPAGDQEPGEIVGRREEHARLWSLARRALVEEQRSALWLRYAEDLSPAEIAGILGKPAVTVRVMLFRARERLATMLEVEPRGSAAGRSHGALLMSKQGGGQP